MGLKSNAYYDSSTSRVHVYINGINRYSAYFDELSDYIKGNNLNENGWPSKWMTNEFTYNMTFDNASFDKNGEEVCNSYGEFYDRWMTAFSFPEATGSFYTQIYLWFYNSNSNSNYSNIEFTMTRNGYSYEKITMLWNCLNEFTYNDLPEAFYNESTTNWDSAVGGSWYFCDEKNDTLIGTDYSVKLTGGKTYKFDYYVSPYLEEVYKNYLNYLVLPDTLYPDDDSIKIPKALNDGYYILTWNHRGHSSSFVEFERYNDDYLSLTRIQDLQQSVVITIEAILEINGLEYSKTFDITILSKPTKLDAPVLEKEIDYDYATTTLKWNSIKKADYYELYSVNGTDYDLIATIPSSATPFYKLPGGLSDTGYYSFVVRAKSYNDDYYTASNDSNTVNYLFDSVIERLNAPALTLEDHYLKWNSVSYANGYELYCDNELVMSFDYNELEFDIYDLNLATGPHSFRMVALSGNTNEFLDSAYSNKIDYTEEVKGIVIFYNGKPVKTIAKSSLAGFTDEKLKESLYKALPTEISLDNGVAIIQKYYLNSIMVTEITRDNIYDHWKKQNYCYLELYVTAIQPLVYDGPKIIWKNANSSLKVDDITSIVNNYCKTGTKDKYVLNLVKNEYEGNGDKAGNYIMTYQCLVGDYVTNINLTIKVSNKLKVDYVYDNKMFSKNIVSREDIVYTCKTIGILPDVDLMYSIVSLHNETKADYYSENAPKGAYNFLIQYESNAGNSGLVQFEVNYNTGSNWQGIEQSSDFPIETFIYIVIAVALAIGLVVFIKNTKKTRKYRRKGGF